MAIDSPLLGKETQASSNRNTLGRTLMAWFILLALLPMSLVAWIGYQQANTTLTQAAEDNLQQAADAKVAFLLNWFDYRFMDLHSQSENQHNVALLMQLKEGLQRSGKSSAAYVKSFDWARRVDVVQKDFITLTRHYDYIYDLFLIDTKGNILYTVAHESDLGANLFTGSL
ncbi:MAG: histidine kinase, partial [Ketobacter sp.]|nr:histidine kinase [Ketobacter sp.]